ncbi:MAG: RagB/SusD family nutrient uptake outer membrane protein [Ignavibacteriae bacterium HGW-Ignavibacteriae-3]|nr:MAG: RagB/SusD family nutrient uptake outer membrane protein [Ignavibacteriae bacterium HGW-Ignavibacteriae-3]
MKKITFLTAIIITAFFFSSCTKDLNVEPIDPNVNTLNNVFKDQAAYKKALAKLYASYAISGQTGGGGGSADIQGIDENFGNYVRQYWGLQELSTDEAIIAWDDATIKNFHWQTWAPNDVFITALYSRIFYTISISNEFIRNADAKMGSVSGTFLSDLKAFKAEARFIRALSYWHAIDMFGNVPFITEADLPGAFFPKRITRTELFTYIESELKAMEADLVPAKQNEYARADRGAAWFLLAKLYLNAKVYIGTDKYTEALTYLNQVIGAGYALDSSYEKVFSADNHTSPEIIFPIAFDGQNTQQYGGMTFILHASNGGGMPLNGIDGGWGGIRTIKDFVSKFNITESNFASTTQYKGADKRGLFFFDKSSWKWDIDNVGTFTEGIGVTKFKNVTGAGGTAPNAHATFVSTDFPMFRLADAYLMYAEAVLRGGSGGNITTALGYVNALRQRAYGNTTGNIAQAALTLDFILDERGRELYWEGHRRTDLVRFGQFTNGTYLWQWKGNVKNGAQTASYRNLYPIPVNDLNANPNLQQNIGY